MPWNVQLRDGKKGKPKPWRHGTKTRNKLKSSGRSNLMLNNGVMWITITNKTILVVVVVCNRSTTCLWLGRVCNEWNSHRYMDHWQFAEFVFFCGFCCRLIKMSVGVNKFGQSLHFFMFFSCIEYQRQFEFVSVCVREFIELNEAQLAEWQTLPFISIRLSYSMRLHFRKLRRLIEFFFVIFINFGIFVADPVSVWQSPTKWIPFTKFFHVISWCILSIECNYPLVTKKKAIGLSCIQSSEKRLVSRLNLQAIRKLCVQWFSNYISLHFKYLTMTENLQWKKKKQNTHESDHLVSFSPLSVNTIIRIIYVIYRAILITHMLTKHKKQWPKYEKKHTTLHKSVEWSLARKLKFGWTKKWQEDGGESERDAKGTEWFLFESCLMWLRSHYVEEHLLMCALFFGFCARPQQ